MQINLHYLSGPDIDALAMTDAEILAAVDRSRLRHVIAAHLSQANNLPRLATAALAGVLGCSADEIVVAEQASGFGWLALS